MTGALGRAATAQLNNVTPLVAAPGGATHRYWSTCSADSGNNDACSPTLFGPLQYFGPLAYSVFITYLKLRTWSLFTIFDKRVLSFCVILQQFLDTDVLSCQRNVWSSTFLRIEWNADEMLAHYTSSSTTTGSLGFLHRCNNVFNVCFIRATLSHFKLFLSIFIHRETVAAQRILIIFWILVMLFQTDGQSDMVTL